MWLWYEIDSGEKHFELAIQLALLWVLEACQNKRNCYSAWLS